MLDSYHTQTQEQKPQTSQPLALLIQPGQFWLFPALSNTTNYCVYIVVAMLASHMRSHSLSPSRPFYTNTEHDCVVTAAKQTEKGTDVNVIAKIRRIHSLSVECQVFTINIKTARSVFGTLPCQADGPTTTLSRPDNRLVSFF